jgi:general stress protein 26
MTRKQFLAKLKAHRLAVLATVAADGSPQAAVIGVAVADDFEVIFDTLKTSRKYANIRHEPRVALELDAGSETLQLQGIAEELSGDELIRCKRIYFAVWDDGPSREDLPDITYFRVRPTWLRYSDFSIEPPRIVEINVSNDVPG